MTKLRIIEYIDKNGNISYFLESSNDGEIWNLVSEREYYSFDEALRTLKKIKEAIKDGNPKYIDEE